MSLPHTEGVPAPCSGRDREGRAVRDDLRDSRRRRRHEDRREVLRGVPGGGAGLHQDPRVQREEVHVPRRERGFGPLPGLFIVKCTTQEEGGSFFILPTYLPIHVSWLFQLLNISGKLYKLL